MILATHGIVGSQIVQFTGLLDDYTGAEAAYSLRLLSSTYTGDAIEVRNSSGTHLDIGFVDGELDTSTLLTHCGAGDGTVSKWYDQSGNGFDATQGTAASQPQIVSSGSVITENGKPAVEFDGSDDYLENSTIQDDSTISIISVYSNTVTNASDRIFGIRDYLDTGQKLTFAHATDNSLRYDGAASTGTITPNLGYKLRYSQRSTTNQYDYINSVLNISDTQTLPNFNGRINIGAVQSRLNYYEGTIQETIMFFSDQSSNRTGIETNINDFYSIYP